MNTFLKDITQVGLVLFFIGFMSCKDLTELNINPNGPTLESANPAFLMTTVLTQAADNYLRIGYDEPFAGVMQYTQKDAWESSNNNYEWSNQEWGNYYDLLRNNQSAYDLAKAKDRPFITGVSLVMKSFIFGLITDLWGDAPYTEALKAKDEGENNLAPAYDDQKTIYLGILDDLKKAAGIFKSLQSSTAGSADVYYEGDPAKWAKFANSLRLRYYMRISSKLPDVAKQGIEEVVASGIYFQSNDDDATMSYPGTNSDNSWPLNTKFDNTSGSNFRRIKMCATFVNELEARNDARLAVWAAKIQTPIVIDANFSSNPDTIINGVRYIHPDAIPQGALVDTDPDYVGIPPSIGLDPSTYNLNPTPGQLSYNPSVSFLNDRYKEASGALLKARLQSYAEVCFILSEAALKGWSVGKNAKAWYEEGVKASLNTWGVGDDYNDYITGSKVAFDGTLEQIITQKWIANWTAAEEAWFDYRRTGFPDLKAGPIAKRKVLPVRFMYPGTEYLLNRDNVTAALNAIEETNFSGAEGKDSPWSKMWVLQGTGAPW